MSNQLPPGFQLESTPEVVEEDERTLGESAARGLGLSGRLAFAPAKMVAGLGDLLSGMVNFGLESRSGLPSPPGEYRLPVNRRELLDERITQMGFPEPSGFAEEFPQELAEFALPGGVALESLSRGRALANVPGALTRTPDARTITTAARQALPQGSQFVRSLADEIGEYVVRSPRAAAASELGGAAGAITAPEVVERAGGGPTAQTVSSLVGAMVGGAPQTVVSTARRAGEKLIGPFTNRGAEANVARQLQEAAADPGAAAIAAREAPEGVPPAQATGDEKLIAMQNRVLADDPVAAERVARELAEAETRTVQKLADEFGPGTDPVNWQQRVVQAASPEGVTIKATQTDDMLDEAFTGFGKAYDEFKGVETNVGAVTAIEGDAGIPVRIANRVEGTELLIPAETRRNVVDWLARRFRTAEISPTGTMSSDDLLELRHAVRKELRRKQRTAANNPTAADEAALLQEANRGFTEILESGLAPEAVARLREVDARYANYKTVEDAALRSGDKGLTATALNTSLNQRAPRGPRARGAIEGATQELVTLQQQGVDVRKILNANDKQQAARVVRDMTPEQLQGAKGDFVREITKKATRKINGEDKLQGKDLLNELNRSRDVLTAAGFTADDLARIETLGREMSVIQSRSTAQAAQLLNDTQSRLIRMVTMFVGARAGTHLFQKFFGRAGAGESLQAARFGSTELQKDMRALMINKSDAIIRDALTNRELFEALMVRPADSIAKQAQASRTIRAWLAKTGQEAVETPEEE